MGPFKEWRQWIEMLETNVGDGSARVNQNNFYYVQHLSIPKNLDFTWGSLKGMETVGKYVENKCRDKK